jgi:predicted nucleotidyltransferase
MNETKADRQLDLTPVFGERAREILNRYIKALKQSLPVEEVWLFGSGARGGLTPDSDLDLLVVLSDDHGLSRPNLACYRVIRRLHTGVPTDVLAVTKSQWESEQKDLFGIFGEVHREGVKLYGNGREEPAALV